MDHNEKTPLFTATPAQTLYHSPPSHPPPQQTSYYPPPPPPQETSYYPPPPPPQEVPQINPYEGNSRYIPPPPVNPGGQRVDHNVNVIQPGFAYPEGNAALQKQISTRTTAAIVMIAISLIITGFSCFICIIPTIFCIYQTSVTNDLKEKDKYSKYALGGSIVSLIFCAISFLFSILLLATVIALGGAGSE